MVWLANQLSNNYTNILKPFAPMIHIAKTATVFRTPKQHTTTYNHPPTNQQLNNASSPLHQVSTQLVHIPIGRTCELSTDENWCYLCGATSNVSGYVIWTITRLHGAELSLQTPRSQKALLQAILTLPPAPPPYPALSPNLEALETWRGLWQVPKSHNVWSPEHANIQTHS